MMALIVRLRKIADFVLIDSPPLLAVNDAKLLSRITDSAIFVVRWEKTSREAVSFAVKILREFHIPLTGAVLVRANAKQHQYYAFGYNGIPAMARYYNG
jgi:Mrp family chromosome partitioning ATPase